MFTSKRARIQKRREMLPGQGVGAQPGKRNWDTAALGTVWNVETSSRAQAGVAHILIQALRQNPVQVNSRGAQPDVILAGQTR